MMHKGGWRGGGVLVSPLTLPACGGIVAFATTHLAPQKEVDAGVGMGESLPWIIPPTSDS